MKEVSQTVAQILDFTCIVAITYQNVAEGLKIRKFDVHVG